MKKLLLMSLLLMFAACGMIWDFNNPDICFFVKNAAGENLLDPNVEGNILDNEITVDYDGNIYGLDRIRTRETIAVWYGLRIEPLNNIDDTPVLKFGEFFTQHRRDERSYQGETLTINWGDGTNDEVKFDLYVKGTHKVIKKIWLNGKLQSRNSLVINIVK
jgi:hypothetical protein